MTRRRWQAEFNGLNRQFFQGRLPDYRVTFIRRANRARGERGYCDTGMRVIFLVPGLADEETRRWLLHEMCHIGCPHHGRRFRAKLEHLARHGETWAKEEASAYDPNEVDLLLPTTAMIARLLEDRCIDRPEWTWAQVRRHVESELGRRLDFSRTAPWAKARWQRMRKMKGKAKRGNK